MREKKWIDCPVCGAKNSMRLKKNLSETVSVDGDEPAEISGLHGQFCEACGEGFWSLASERKLAREAAAYYAQKDAEHVVAADLASVQEAARSLHISVQGVHKMMNEGRLRYVYAGGRKLPARSALRSSIAPS